MLRRFLSRRASVRGILGAAGLVLGPCVALLLIGFTWNYVDQRYFAPRRSAHVLETLNEQKQTLDQQMGIIQRAITADPKNDYAWYLRARKLTEQKRYVDAAHGWAQLEGKLTGALNNLYRSDLGMCLLFADRPVESLSCFQESLHRQPEHMSSRVFMASAYMKIGLTEPAREQLKMLDSLDPQWRRKFLSIPEWPDERRSAIESLETLLETASR
jgi:tetratricopeptide (TPR) repeat protein